MDNDTYLKLDNRANLRGRSCTVLDGDRERVLGQSYVQTHCIH